MSEVVVVGGGPTGVVTALALARSSNAVTVRLLAADPVPGAIRPPSQDPRSYVLWPNALGALSEIRFGAGSSESSVHDWLRGRSFVRSVERLDIRADHGQHLWAMPIGAFGRRYGRPSLLVDAWSFQDGLRGLAKGESDAGRMTAEWNHTVTGLAMDGSGGVWVDYEDDSGTRKNTVADLVVAADGRGSSTRRRWNAHRAGSAGFEPFSDDVHWSDLVAVVGETAGTHRFSRDGLMFASHGDDLRFGALQRPGSGDSSVWLAYVRGATLFGNAWVCGASPHAGILDATGRDRLRSVFRSFHHPVGDLLATDAMWWTALGTVRPGHNWYQQRVLLVGDAAHAVLPDTSQGCAMGFEDAVALSKAWTNAHPAFPPTGTVEEKDASLAAMMKEFVDHRAPRAARAVATSELVGLLSHMDFGSDAVRDLALAHGAPPAVLADLHDLMGGAYGLA